MITPHDARRFIDSTGADYGQDVVLPDCIDTSECQEFFGTRCPDNVHVKSDRTAHVDRADPRDDPIGHLKYDVGVPYAVMAAPVGAMIGAAAMKRNRKNGALVGGTIGLVLGMVADTVNNSKNHNSWSLT